MSIYSQTTLLVVSLLLSCASFQLNASMINPALHVMANSLGQSDYSISLSQAAFFSISAASCFILPRASEAYGRKNILLLCLFLMFIGTVSCGITNSFYIFVLSRALQGVSGSIMGICLMIVRSEVNRPAVRYTIIGIISSINGGIAGVDSIAGGYIAQNFGYKSIFLGISLVSIAAILAVMGRVQSDRLPIGKNFDWIGSVLIVLLAIQPLTLLFGVLSFDIVPKYIQIIVTVIICIGIIVRANLKTDAIIPVKAVKKRKYYSLIGTSLLTLAGVFASVNGIAPSWAQNQKLGFGFSPEDVSLYLLFPYSISGLISGILIGKLASKISPVILLRVGLVGSVISLIILSKFGIDNYIFMIISMVMVGFFYAGITNVLLNMIGVMYAENKYLGLLPGLNAGFMNIGAALSFIILPNIMSLTAINSEMVGRDYQYAITCGAALILAALFMSLTIPRMTTPDRVIEKV